MHRGGILSNGTLGMISDADRLVSTLNLNGESVDKEPAVVKKEDSYYNYEHHSVQKKKKLM